MPKRQILSDLIVTAKERYNDGVKALFGTNENWSVRSDGTDLIFEEEGTGEVLRINTGNDVADELASSGSTPIAQGALNEQNPTAHATEHENGGVDELNVGGLSGDLADAQDPKTHATTHQDGGADELIVENLAATSTDTNLVFRPDGAGGVQAAGTTQLNQQDLWDRTTIGDDFDDNKLTDRDPPSTTASSLTNLTENFRPESWIQSETSGITVDAANQQLEIVTPGDDDLQFGGARLDFTFNDGIITATFEDISIPYEDPEIYFGFTTVTDLSTELRTSGDGVLFRNDFNGNDQLVVVDTGTDTQTAFSSSLDWSTTHTIEVELNTNTTTAEVRADGTTQATDSTNAVVSDYNIAAQWDDRDAATQTLAVSAIIGDTRL